MEEAHGDEDIGAGSPLGGLGDLLGGLGGLEGLEGLEGLGEGAGGQFDPDHITALEELLEQLLGDPSQQ
jgi:hypothetical protein